MRQIRPSIKRALQFSLWMAGWLILGAHLAQGESVILHLRNGDRVQGNIINEDTNRVVLATSWIKELAVPLSAIERRELVTNAVTTATAAKTPATKTNAVAAANPPAKPAPSAPATKPAVPAPKPKKTNVVVAVKTAPKPAPKPKPTAPKTKPKKPRYWKGKLSLGTSTQFGATDSQLYTGRLNLTYARPYKSNPKNFFRNIFDYAVDYGETDGVKSSDRMHGSMKTDFDVGKEVFIYNLAGAGYDNVRKIDLEYEFGPGGGYHLFTGPKFIANLEIGLNYQVQNRSGSPDVRNYYFRLAEDLTWKITKHMNFVQKAELFPQAEDWGQYRARIDATLSFPVWDRISLNLSLLDLYDTSPAAGVDRNEVQIRSMVGITF